jgi:hypothetical protein
VALAVLTMPAGASALTKKPQPELARQFVVAEASGKVFVKPPGAAGFERVTERRTIPVGTTVNASNGRAKLVAAIGGDRRARGEFWAGAFIATQKRKTKLIDLELTGGNFAACGKAKSAANRRRIARRLRANAKGPFRTKGRHTAGTVRGTKWTTEDRCASTTVATERGEVDASVGAASLEVPPGQVLEVRCDPPVQLTGRPYRYCIATLNDLANGVFAVSIGTAVHDGPYTTCVAAPNGSLQCRELELPEPTPGGNFRISVLGCLPDRGVGEYTITWHWQNRILGTLIVQVNNPFQPGGGACLVTEEEAAQGPPA